MNLTKKQQVLAIATMIVFLIIIWQVYTMIRTPAGVQRVASLPAPSAMTEAVSPISMDVHQKTAQSAGSDSAAFDGDEAASMPADQEAYLRLTSELQMIQMQRTIAEGYAAIAAARLNAAKALSELNKYNVEGMGSALTRGETKGEYELIYLGQQNGEWAATLKKGSQTFDVVTGTVLGKGARVLHVNGDGVVIMRNKKQMLVTFNGYAPVIETDEDEAIEEIAPAALEVKKPEPVAPLVPKRETLVKPAAAQLPTMPTSQPIAAKPPAPAPAPKAVVPAAAAPMSAEPVAAQLPTMPTSQPIAAKPPAPAPAPKAVVPAAMPQAAPMQAADFQQLQALLPTDQAKKIQGNGGAHKEDIKKEMVKPENPVKPTVKAEEKEEIIPAETTESIAEDIQLAPKSDTYTLQMIANSEPNSLRKFAAAQQWGEEAKIYRTTLKGKPWYVLAYGEYENIAAAKKALAALPGKSQKWTPFIRKLSTIAPAMPTEKSAISVKKEMSTEPVVIASSEKQLLAAKPTAYTIQLLANAQLPVIEDFIKMNSLGKKAMWYRTTREGADFYVLTYGIYNDLTAAKQGMKELPNSLESVTPFVRQLSSIQTAIKQK